MHHCDSFYRSLDRKLEQKMTIDEIAKDLCSQTKDPRRNIILDIKEYKGEDYLIKNADWLGYQIQKHEKAKVASYCEVLSIAPISTMSAMSSNSIATVTDTKLKEVICKELNVKNASGSFKDASEVTVFDVKPEETKDNININPEIEIKEKNDGLQVESEKYTDKTLDTTPISLGNRFNECTIGKPVPNCVICDFAKNTSRYTNTWSCEEDFDYNNKFDDIKTCSICGFRTDIKQIFKYHSTYVHNKKSIEESIHTCPCGCGFGCKICDNKISWLTKSQMDIRNRKRKFSEELKELA
jgi:hypothetical protein